MRIFSSVWKSFVPSNVTAFTWRMLLDRVPSKDNLRKQNVNLTEGNSMCSFCSQQGGIVKHLFFSADLLFKFGISGGMAIEWDRIGLVSLSPILHFYWSSKIISIPTLA